MNVASFTLAVALLLALWVTVRCAVAVTSTLNSALTDTETVNNASGTLVTNDLSETVALTGTTTPAVTKRVRFDQAMTSGAATIDLTAMPGLTGDETVTALGLKMQFLKITNKASNANKITVVNGGTNPYRLDGATTVWTFVLAVGQSYLINLNNASDAVASGHKTIDITGTGAQVLQFQATFG